MITHCTQPDCKHTDGACGRATAAAADGFAVPVDTFCVGLAADSNGRVRLVLYAEGRDGAEGVAFTFSMGQAAVLESDLRRTLDSRAAVVQLIRESLGRALRPSAVAAAERCGKGPDACDDCADVAAAEAELAAHPEVKP